MSSAFPNLFSPLDVGNITLRNRIVSTGHGTALAEDGFIGDALVAYHEARARGGAGLIVTEVTMVHESGVFLQNALKAYREDHVPGYARAAETLHKHGARFFVQLFHPGRELQSTPDGSKPVSYGPSAIPTERHHIMPAPMSGDLIEDIIDSYGKCAARMRDAGVDGVEIVASHGYLPAQFLNGHANRRTDKWGGSVENRMRFLRETVREVRKRAGEDFVVGLRISGDEKDQRGLKIEDVEHVCGTLTGDGNLDYFSIVAGASTDYDGATHVVPPMYYEQGYTAPLGRRVRERTDKPVIVTGRINQPQTAEAIIARGDADACGMTRAQIADPELANKAREGRADDIRACIGCNQACVDHFLKGYPISCIQNPVSGRELTYGNIAPATDPKKVLVAGGGPAGMKAAAIAAERGHDVTLYEASERLGGQATLAQSLPDRAEFGGIITNLESEIARYGVKVERNAPVTRELVDREAPDAVVVATGATPYRPEMDSEGAHVVDAWQVLRGQVNVGTNVAVADWRCDWVGLGVAEILAREGCNVTLCVDGYIPGQNIQQYVRDTWLGKLHKLNVRIQPCVRLFGADGDDVYFQHMITGDPVIQEEIDTLVLAMGHVAETRLAEELKGTDRDVHVVGDAMAPRTAEEAVLEGFRAGAAI